MNKENNTKLVIELKEELEQEYSDLTQEYKSCEVMIESRVRQKDILERQTAIKRQLSKLEAELSKHKRIEREEVKMDS